MSYRNKYVYRIGVTSLFTIFFAFCAIPSYATTPDGILSYSRHLNSNIATKAEMQAALQRYQQAENLWDVLRKTFSLPHYDNNPAVREKIAWYMSNQDDLIRSASRAAPYLYFILQQVKLRHLPAEMVLLPIVESGYNPYAISSVGASGIWQMMPDTASGLGVKEDWWYDGRRDIVTSTQAALDYLAYLENFFSHNWLLAIAAYNTGEGNVLAAIKRNMREGLSTDFWSLPVAQQTKDYVPSILALAIIIGHPDQYPIYFPTIKNAPYLAQVDTGTQLDLQYAASLAGISYKTLMQLNPGYNRLATSRHGPYKLILPIDNVLRFSDNLSHANPNNDHLWFHYKVHHGDTFLTIAKQFNTTVATIKNMNDLQHGTLKSGNDILIPKKGDLITAFIDKKDNVFIMSETQHLTQRILNRITPKLAPPPQVVNKYKLKSGDTIYMVRKNDTLDSIAKHFNMKKADILAANPNNGSSIMVGKQIIIPTHIKTMNIASLTHGQKLANMNTTYRVQKGDTVNNIAEKFHTSIEALRSINMIDDNSLNPGEELIIPRGFTS